MKAFKLMIFYKNMIFIKFYVYYINNEEFKNMLQKTKLSYMNWWQKSLMKKILKQQIN